MYKDKDKQREANKAAKARQRARQGMTVERRNVISSVIPLPRPKDVGITFDDNGDVHVPDGVFTKLMAQAKPGHIRVSLPGDADYVPLCQFTRDWMAAR